MDPATGTAERAQPLTLDDDEPATVTPPASRPVDGREESRLPRADAGLTALYTHTGGGRTGRVQGRKGRLGTGAEAPPASTTDPQVSGEPAGPERASADTAEPELAAPQLRLDAELPRSASPSCTEPDTSRRRGGTATRYVSPREPFARSVRSLEPISELEAASFAGRFAADFQSFDEDNPARRAEVLRSLLADPQASTWGWSGAGRQRADSPLPGRLHRASDTVVFVEVVVRATTYARACPPPEPVERPDGTPRNLAGLVGPSCAPTESDPGWVAVEANWLRMTVPITRDPDNGRLVVDPHLVPDHSS